MNNKLFIKSPGGTISLASGEGISRVEIFRAGDWSNSYKQIKAEKADLEAMVTNFEKNILGLEKGELQVNYSHNSHEKAAGWITALAVQGKKLIADIRWTPAAKKSIEEEEYKYFSSEIDFVHEDDESGKKTKNVLVGGALTNIPFVKGLSAVSLSETHDLREVKSHFEQFSFYEFFNQNDMKTFKTYLSALQGKEKISPDEAEMLTKLHASLSAEEQEETKEDVESLMTKTSQAQASASDAAAKAELANLQTQNAELQAKVKTLSEKSADPTVLSDLKSAQEKLSAQQAIIDKMKFDSRKAEITKQLEKFTAEGRILPKDMAGTVDMLMELSEEKGDKMLSWMSDQPVKIDFSEKGSDIDPLMRDDEAIAKEAKEIHAKELSTLGKTARKLHVIMSELYRAKQ